MKYFYISILCLFTTGCALIGYQSEQDKQTNEDYVNAAIEAAGGYKPKNYENCPEGTQVTEFADGYICREHHYTWEKYGAYGEAAILIIVFLVLLL